MQTVTLSLTHTYTYPLFITRKFLYVRAFKILLEQILLSSSNRILTNRVDDFELQELRFWF